MTYRSTAHAIMELSKEIEKFAAEDNIEMFPWRDEISLDLGALGQYMIDRKEELGFEGL
ncbi:hypothetical protein [Candidatus Nitrotoga arctica]|uniref:Uncharacterized protein n=1 Tax=Candidatus Nitrotoga arctica TaxID=453162 RepID=A0ABN8AK20_9PROT|nr:hypothetical protein [Candidatus Nitrotoga arctica]CAG9933076.1 conserved protein of unknown function [Candidatus Nitrotoga arctica]